MITKLKSMSKRTLSVLLVLLMVVSTVTVGVITTTAAYSDPNESVGANADSDSVGAGWSGVTNARIYASIASDGDYSSDFNYYDLTSSDNNMYSNTLTLRAGYNYYFRMNIWGDGWNTKWYYRDFTFDNNTTLSLGNLTGTTYTKNPAYNRFQLSTISSDSGYVDVTFKFFCGYDVGGSTEPAVVVEQAAASAPGYYIHISSKDSGMDNSTTNALMNVNGDNTYSYTLNAGKYYVNINTSSAGTSNETTSITNAQISSTKVHMDCGTYVPAINTDSAFTKKWGNYYALYVKSDSQINVTFDSTANRVIFGVAEVPFDGYYIGGRMAVTGNGTASGTDIYTGEHSGDWGDLSSTNIKFTPVNGSNTDATLYKVLTGKTIAQLSAKLSDKAQNFGVHDQNNWIGDITGTNQVGTGQGDDFEKYNAESKALDIGKKTTNPSTFSDNNDMNFSDPTNDSDGLVTIWLKVTNEARTEFKIWYENVGETKKVADSVTLNATPSPTLTNANMIVSATLSNITSPLTASQLDYTFKVGDTAIATVNGGTAKFSNNQDSYTYDGVTYSSLNFNATTGKVTFNATSDAAKTLDFSVEVSTEEKYIDAVHGSNTSYRTVSDTATGVFKAPTVHITNTNLTEASVGYTAGNWTELTDQNGLNYISGVSVSAPNTYTFAFSSTTGYDPTFNEYEVDTAKCKFATIEKSHLDVEHEGEDTTVRTYVIKPNANCTNVKLYVDVPNQKVYAIGQYSPATNSYVDTSKPDDAKQVTYYFAEDARSKTSNGKDGPVRKSDASTSNSSTANESSGMRIAYWNNSVESRINVHYKDITERVLVKNSNKIFVNMNELYVPSSLHDNLSDWEANDKKEFYIYKVTLPVWATSFRFVTSGNGGIDAAMINAKSDLNSWDHSLTLNPNRVYLFYSDVNNSNINNFDAKYDNNSKTPWRVRGVILDKNLWNESVTTNWTDTYPVDTNLINYTDITTISSPQNDKVNQGLKTLYKADNTAGATPIPLYFGNFNNNAETNNLYRFNLKANLGNTAGGGSWYSAVWNLASDEVSTTKLNGNGYGYLMDTTEIDPINDKWTNRHPVFDYEALSAQMVDNTVTNKAAQLVEEGLQFPFYKSEFNGITTYSYDSTTDLNREYKAGTGGAKNSIAVATQNRNKVDDSGYAVGKDTDGSFTGLFPFGGNDNKYSNTGFGMEFDMNFYMTNTGYLKDSAGNNQDIAFNFSGDDDVWVYVDGVLVLDLGGDHKISAGSINFSDGYVYYKSPTRSINDSNWTSQSDGYATNASYIKRVSIKEILNAHGKEWNKTDAATTHTFQMFYMERGAFQSNCSISFNLPQASGLNVMNHVKATNVNVGLKDIALKASNSDYFTYNVSYKEATPSMIDALKLKEGYANALNPDYSSAWSATKGDPTFPINSDTSRVFMDERYVLSSTSDTRNPASYAESTLSAQTSTYQTLLGTNYKLSDRYLNAADPENASVSGQTMTTADSSNGYAAGDFFLLGGQKATFDDKIRPNSFVQVLQKQNLGEAKADEDNNNIIGYSYISDNNTGNYYTTSYDIVDESTKKVMAKGNFAQSTSDSYNATDESDNLTTGSGGLYFTNYSGTSNTNPAMTVNFYNEIAVGKIKIEKKLQDNETSTANFRFHLKFASVFGNDSDSLVTASDHSEIPSLTYKVYSSEDDNPVGTGATQIYGSTGIKIQAGQYAIVDGVPVETLFQVIEDNPGAFSLTKIEKSVTNGNDQTWDTTQKTKVANRYTETITSGDQLEARSTSVVPDGAESHPSHNYVAATKTHYYTNMIPTVEETLVNGKYISTSTVVFTNKKEKMTVTFKYYDRKAVTDTVAQIDRAPVSYSVTIDSPELYYKDSEDPSKGYNYKNMINSATVKFYMFSNIATNNVVDQYHLWTQQSDALSTDDNVVSLKDLKDLQIDPTGNTKFDVTTANLVYHTNSVGQIQTKDDAKGEKWVTYMDNKGNEVLNASNKTAEEFTDSDTVYYGQISQIVVWLYNEPREYSVKVYGTAADGANTKAITGKPGYLIADGTKEKSGVFYYNQRFGEKDDGATPGLNDGGYLTDYYNLPAYQQNFKPVNETASTVTKNSKTYNFAYWSYDSEGKTIASTDIKFNYRITNNTNLYAVYSENNASINPGMTLTKNVTDSYVTSNGVQKTRLNSLVTIYGCERKDFRILKTALVNLYFTKQKESGLSDADIQKIMADETFQNDLKNEIKKYTANTFSSSVTVATTGLSVEITPSNVTAKGYTYVIKNNELDDGTATNTVALTVKNRMQFTTIFNTDNLVISKEENTNHAVQIGEKYYRPVTIVSLGAMYFKDSENSIDWKLSDNYVQYDFPREFSPATN